MRIKSMGVRFQSRKDRESNFVSMACRARGLSTVLLEKVLRFFLSLMNCFMDFLPFRRFFVRAEIEKNSCDRRLSEVIYVISERF